MRSANSGIGRTSKFVFLLVSMMRVFLYVDRSEVTCYGSCRDLHSSNVIQVAQSVFSATTVSKLQVSQCLLL